MGIKDILNHQSERYAAPQARIELVCARQHALKGIESALVDYAGEFE